MNRHQLRHLPEELANEILADQETMRVPMSMIDHRTVIGNVRTLPRLADGLPAQAHRNGWRLPARDSKDLELLYAQRDAETSTAYLTPTGYGSTPSTELRGSKPGDACTCRGVDFPLDVGSPGHIELHEGRLRCRPDNPKSATDARSLKQVRDLAYQAYENDLVNAWKESINQQTHDGKPRRTAGVVLHDTADSAYRDYDLEISEAYKRG
jgi:hypothetical protein